jgi:2'-hydroxyisoflavone reductase
MRILVLGGTSFVGRAIVEDALRTGAEVTLFSRGKTGTDLFPGLPRLIGDRDTGDCTALRDGRWDAVVDVSGYVARHVGQAMDALGDRAGRYLFISSHAVYQREGVLAWDRQRGEPPLTRGFSPEQEQAAPAQARVP